MQTPKTVAELAIAQPSSIPVFQRLNIDYCCHGDQSVDQACKAAGLSAGELMRLIEKEPVAADVRSWDGSSLTEVVRFVIDTHHAYTRQSLETLQWMSAKVRERHGAHHPELATLARLVAEAVDDLMPHMMKEEQILFPYIEQVEEARMNGTDAPTPFFGTARNPVRMMMAEHETVGEKLAEMRSLTKDYTLPEGACTTFTAYFNLLQDLERDLHNHIHLENNILFPRAIALEDEAPKRAAAGAAW
jgi:regulator of cell morphogenesis and NO signaling